MIFPLDGPVTRGKGTQACQSGGDGGRKRACAVGGESSACKDERNALSLHLRTAAPALTIQGNLSKSLLLSELLPTTQGGHEGETMLSRLVKFPTK